MKLTHLIFTATMMFTGAFAGATEPTATARNSPRGRLNDNSHIRNMYRQRILNKILAKRGLPAAITAQVYSLSFFDPLFMIANKWESSFGWLNRVMYAKVPGGPKSKYSGLHPRYVEYRFHDKSGDLLYAQCFLQVYTSRSIPGRTFVRSNQCLEQSYAHTVSGQKGFHFAVVAQVAKGPEITQYQDLTAEWSKDNTLDSETKPAAVLTDPNLFGDGTKNADDGEDPAAN